MPRASINEKSFLVALFVSKKAQAAFLDGFNPDWRQETLNEINNPPKTDELDFSVPLQNAWQDDEQQDNLLTSDDEGDFVFPSSATELFNQTKKQLMNNGGFKADNEQAEAIMQTGTNHQFLQPPSQKNLAIFGDMTREKLLKNVYDSGKINVRTLAEEATEEREKNKPREPYRYKDSDFMPSRKNFYTDEQYISAMEAYQPGHNKIQNHQDLCVAIESLKPKKGNYELENEYVKDMANYIVLKYLCDKMFSDIQDEDVAEKIFFSEEGQKIRERVEIFYDEQLETLKNSTLTGKKEFSHSDVVSGKCSDDTSQLTPEEIVSITKGTPMQLGKDTFIGDDRKYDDTSFAASALADKTYYTDKRGIGRIQRVPGIYDPKNDYVCVAFSKGLRNMAAKYLVEEYMKQNPGIEEDDIDTEELMHKKGGYILKVNMVNEQGRRESFDVIILDVKGSSDENDFYTHDHVLEFLIERSATRDTTVSRIETLTGIKNAWVESVEAYEGSALFDQVIIKNEETGNIEDSYYVRTK